MAPKTKQSKMRGTKDVAASPRSESKALLKWPLIEHTPPARDLSLGVLLPDQILTISNLWPSSLCKAYIKFLSTLPLTTTPGKPKKGDAVRVNDRYQIDDPAFAERLWSGTALRDLVEHPMTAEGVEMTDDERKQLWGGEVLGLNSNIRIYRYTKGQYFDKHYDDSNNISFSSANSPTSVPAKTTWTLLLYLSSQATGCKGGETVFYPDPPSKRNAAPDPLVAEPEVGMALLHRHGSDCLVHEGREVVEGEKWVIRSDLCVNR